MQVNNASQQCEKRNQTMLIVVTMRQNQQACLASWGETTEQLSWPITSSRQKQQSETSCELEQEWTVTMDMEWELAPIPEQTEWAEITLQIELNPNEQNRWNPKWNNWASSKVEIA